MHTASSEASAYCNRQERRALRGSLERGARRGIVGKHQFSQDTINRLTGTMYRLIHELFFVGRIAKKQNPTKPEIHCSQTYLANKCGVTREYVSRATSVLADLGLIVKIFRRAERGVYKTCLYFITDDCRWLIGRLMNVLSSKEHRVMYTSRKSTDSGTSLTRMAAFVPTFTPPPRQ